MSWWGAAAAISDSLSIDYPLEDGGNWWLYVGLGALLSLPTSFLIYLYAERPWRKRDGRGGLLGREDKRTNHDDANNW